MDWFLIVTTAAALAVTAAALWNMYRMKKEVFLFSDQIGQALDYIIAGKEFQETQESTSDTLWGKCSERFHRVSHIHAQKEAAVLKEKQQIKELISNISHQTRTPVANIKLYMEFLQEEPLSEQGREFLAHLCSQVEKLDFLLQSMVKMSRLETGTIQIKKERSNLNETIAGALGEIVPAAARKQLTLSVSCDEGLNIIHDRKWTEEAIFNVLDNAVKYTAPEGSITVTVVPLEIYTRISIKDTGRGIPLERQAEIFSRFYREPEIHDQSGIGIGLYLTRKILELQDGYIEVRSHPGLGSEFCIYLQGD